METLGIGTLRFLLKKVMHLAMGVCCSALNGIHDVQSRKGPQCDSI